jgi:DNA (cytosine-5)-methyltransferase 1
VDQQQFADILNKPAMDSNGDPTDMTLRDLLSTHSKELEINDQIVAQAEADAAKCGYETRQFYTLAVDERGKPVLNTAADEDILASQNTIHPEQNRVFSIRELMRFLSIPEDFKWDSRELTDLNSLSAPEKVEFLKQHELNIRKCLGEAVPTEVFRSIAKSIFELDQRVVLKEKSVKDIIRNFNLTDKGNLVNFIDKNINDFPAASKIAELANSERNEDAAYYTSQDVAFTLLSDLPEFKSKKALSILEPAVGVGNFLPILFHKYKHIDKVKLDLIDINSQNIDILKHFLKK